MKITFWGAARQVTGSMHLLTLDNGYKILVDCGLNYEQKREMNDSVFEFPFNPADIDTVILTHAHIDHSGNLPALVHRGFKGNILCTEATAALTKFLLFDSSHIQFSEYKGRLARASRNRRHLVPKPIYADKQVQECMDRMVTLNFNRVFSINEDVSVELIEAGHLLGAASVVVSVRKNGHTTRIGFTGDLGRSHAELIRVAVPMEDLDFLVTETTYGGRKHRSSEHPEEELLTYIEETCVKKRSRLIIPAFSVGRTQAIVHVLNKLEKAGKLPPVKVFVDSPLAVRTTHVYENHNDLLNADALRFVKQHGSLFNFEDLHWVEDQDGHDELMAYTDRCIIVSAAGMVEGGRIQEHVRNNIQNPFSTILIAGYCSEGTLGHRLLQGMRSIAIKGKDYPIYAHIASTDVFSSHPDGDEIFRYIEACASPSLKRIFLVHGDEPNLVAMKQRLQDARIENVEIPDTGDEYVLP
jgi:metallo-beta-lactamase family protein